MLFPTLRKLAAQRGYKKDNNAVYGLEEGIPFTLGHTQDFSNKVVSAYLGKATDEQIKQIESFIKEKSKEFKINRYRLNESELTVFFPESIKSTPLETLNRYIVDVSAFLNNLGIGEAQICNECLEKCGSETYIQGNLLVFAHEKCLRKYGLKPAAAKEAYLKPALWAMLGAAAVSIIVCMILIMLSSQLFAAIIAVSWAAERIYAKTYGGEGVKKYITLSGAVAAATVFFNVLYWSVTIYIETSTLSVSDIAGLFISADFLAYTTLTIVVTLLALMFILLYRAWRSKKKAPVPKRICL